MSGRGRDGRDTQRWQRKVETGRDKQRQVERKMVRDWLEQEEIRGNHYRLLEMTRDKYRQVKRCQGQAETGSDGRDRQRDKQLEMRWDRKRQE